MALTALSRLCSDESLKPQLIDFFYSDEYEMRNTLFELLDLGKSQSFLVELLCRIKWWEFGMTFWGRWNKFMFKFSKFQFESHWRVFRWRHEWICLQKSVLQIKETHNGNNRIHGIAWMGYTANGYSCFLEPWRTQRYFLNILSVSIFGFSNEISIFFRTTSKNWISWSTQFSLEIQKTLC